MLLEIGVPGEKYNISSDVEVDNLTLASEISNIMGIDLIYKLEYPEKTRGVNDVRYSISGNKIRDLGWSPQWTIQEGLKDVIQWYMTNK